MSKKKWLPLEINPDTFNSYFKRLGQQKLHCVDIYGFSEDLLDMITKPVHAVLLVYPINDKENKDDTNLNQIDLNKIWFIKQTISNSCGTVAILHILGNLKNQFPLDKDSIAEEFFNKVEGLNPENKATELENNQAIEKLHNEFVSISETQIEEDDVDIHFVVFLEIDGKLIELDGRKKSPTIHCKTNATNFLKDTSKIIQQKFIECNSNDLRFSALAVTS